MTSWIKCGTCGEVEPLKWKNVKEELPEPDVDVLIYEEKWNEIMVAHIHNKEMIDMGGSFWFVTATENLGFDKDEIDWWMPLPAFPEDKE